MKIKSLFLVTVMSLISTVAYAADVVGSVDTTFKLLGANHKIVMEVFDYPLVYA